VTNIGFWAFKDTALRSITIPESVVWLGSEAFFRAPITSAVIPAKFIAQYGTIGLSPELSSSLLLSELANSFATDDAVSAAEARGIASVTSDPASFGLFDSTQYEANRITGVAEGKAAVTSNPTAYSLFTESSIMDMNLGSLMLKKGANNNALDLELTIETKDNLATNGWQVAERISRSVSMAGVQRQFLRVRADAPYVAPNVKVLAHQTLGNILTDGAGRVLYFFAADSSGGNPVFSGPSWPYVSVPAAPKADAGVTATLGSSSFGRTNGPFLTVNTRPAYTYAGDTTAGQANGHGSGWVWYTIKADGTINQ
jgi:predicted lipoprotein with Yx(FWY)xxD motif